MPVLAGPPTPGRDCVLATVSPEVDGHILGSAEKLLVLIVDFAGYQAWHSFCWAICMCATTKCHTGNDVSIFGAAATPAQVGARI